MKVVTPQQMREIDRRAIERIGMPSLVLMENAALRVVDEAVRMLGGTAEGKRVVIVAGKGNNGGDALAVTRHLYNRKARLGVYLTCKMEELAGDARVNLDILKNMGLPPVELTGEDKIELLEKDLERAELVIDGILGTGLKGDVTGAAREAILAISRHEAPVLSIDIPSGIGGDTGRVHGVCVKADRTVTFGLPKVGLLVHPGCEYAGELVVADIGIPACVMEDMNISLYLIDEAMVSALIPPRKADSHKGDYGRVMIVTGSTGMTGAGILAAGAALRTGSGLVYLAVPASLAGVYDSALAEAVTIPLEDETRGSLSKKCLPALLERMKNMSAIAIGPGLSLRDDAASVVAEVVKRSESPLILDADALNALAEDLTPLKELRCRAVVTPHPGEMARLTGLSVREVQENRIEVAREFAARWKLVTVLKGSRTVVASPEGEVYINITGNPGMATGGAGDVLTGIIAALIGQGAGVLEAAAAGVYLHGLAGDNGARIKGEHGLIAGDIVDQIPFAINGLIGKFQRR